MSGWELFEDTDLYLVESKPWEAEDIEPLNKLEGVESVGEKASELFKRSEGE